MTEWQWKATEVRSIDGHQTWPGYTMHSSAQPRHPEALCRWGMYKVSDRLVVIVLNGQVFGYDKSGITLKTQARIERCCLSMGHSPVNIPTSTRKKS